MVRSRSALAALGAASVALALAACGGGSDANGSAGGDGAKKEFAFAVVAEKTGPFAAYGTQLEAGVLAAVDDLNRDPNSKFVFKPKVYDCQSDKSVCVQQTRQAVTSDKMPVVIGPIVSVDILPSAEVTQRAKVPHLVMAVLNKITDDYDNTFRWSVQSDRSNQTVVDYVKAQIKPGETVAIVNATTDFGKGGAAQQTEQLGKIGIKPVVSIAHDPDQADYTPLITQLKAANPTYILLSDSNPADIAKLLRQSKDLGLQGQWIGADASGTIDLAGDAAKGYMTVSPWFPGGDNKELTDKLIAKGVKNPGWISAMAYDATLGVAKAAQEKGTSSEEVKTGLESLSSFDGLARKAWTFTADDRRGQESSQIANWNGTGYEVVWPKG
jgi:branched-chain amino acid transport system substrate-binding protein